MSSIKCIFIEACAMIYNQEPEERDSGFCSGASTLTIMPTPHLSMIADYIGKSEIQVKMFSGKNQHFKELFGSHVANYR